MTQPGADQHQRRVPVREGTDYPRPSPDLPVHPFDHIVGSDLCPVLRGKVTVGQRFLNSRLYLLCGFRQLQGLQFRNYCGSLLPGRFLALLRVDRFELLAPGENRHIEPGRNHQS